MKPQMRGSSFFVFLCVCGWVFFFFFWEIPFVLGQFSWGLSTKCILWAESRVRLGTLQMLTDCSKLSMKLMVNIVMEKCIWFWFAFQKDVWETQLGHMVFIDSFLCSLSLQGDFLVGAGHWPAWELHFSPSIWIVRFVNASFKGLDKHCSADWEVVCASLQTEKWYAGSLHDILDWLLFFSWVYLTS